MVRKAPKSVSRCFYRPTPHAFLYFLHTIYRSKAGIIRNNQQLLKKYNNISAKGKKSKALALSYGFVSRKLH